jgi:hypothetical protein
VITYFAGKRRIYAFCREALYQVPPPLQHVYLRYWDGTEWKWADLGKPPGLDSTDSSIPEAITYRKAGTQRIACFVVGEDGHLYRNSWNGTQWKWVDQGHPAGTALAEGSNQRPGAIAYVAGGTTGPDPNRWTG